jgi:hypothetical protein
LWITYSKSTSGDALGAGPHGEDLVGTDAEVPVARKRYCAGRQVQAAARLVEHHEIVARALHLGEANPHSAGLSLYPRVFATCAVPDRHESYPPMRIPRLDPRAAKPSPPELVNAILARRGGAAHQPRPGAAVEPAAGARLEHLSESGAKRIADQLRNCASWAICTVALLTGALNTNTTTTRQTS